MLNFGRERRRYKRINKQFILNYFEKDNPAETHEITQLKNISEGGMCFIASKSTDSGSILGIKLKTPYLADTTYFEGKILACHEKVPSLVYEIRLEFEPLNEQAKFLINKLMEVFGD